MTDKTKNFEIKFDEPVIEDDIASIQINKEVYLENLPDGFTKKMVKTLEDYNVSYIDCVEKNVAEKAVEIMKDNDKVQTVIVQAPFGTYQKDKIISTVKRDVKFPIPGTDKTDSAPRITSVVKWHGAKASRSKHKELMKYLKDALK